MNRVVVCCAVALAACPSPLRRPESPDVVLSGSATWGGFNRRADPLGGVAVSLWLGATPVKATSTADGAFKLTSPATAVTTATFTAWANGFAPRVTSMRVGERTELQTSFALEPLEALECVDTACTDGLGRLKWSDAPSGVQASGLVLDDRDMPSLPGADALLVAAAVELDGGTSGTLRLRVPRTSWKNVVDTKPGTGAIEAPVAVLTPSERAWKSATDATLRTEAGLPIAENQLESIRSGTFAAGVTASVQPIDRGVIGVFGGPAMRGCVEGTVIVDGAAAAGLTVFPLDGQPAASSASGDVCFEVPISTDPQPARVQYAGLVYAATTVPAATAAGTCGSNGCRALGALSVRSDTVATVAPCSVSVRVVDEADKALAGAIVIGMDDGLNQAAFSSICGRMGTRCTLTGATDANGVAALVVPVQGGLELSVKAQTMTGARFGSAVLSACPREAVTLRASQGRESIAPTVTFGPSTITWEPAQQPAFRLVVERDGGVAWSVSSARGFTPPVTWGTTPANAEVVQAPLGTVQLGDVVQLTFDSVPASGVVVSGTASAVRE